MKSNKIKFLINLATIFAITFSFMILATNSAIAANCNGTCQDISQPCSGSYAQGLCPGTANIQCCTSGTWLESQTPPTTQSNSLGRTITIPNPLKTTSFIKLIDRITNWLLIIGAPIMTLMIIVGAFQLMIARGDSTKVTTGRQTITWAVVGYALLLLSKSLIFIINEVLGVR